MRRETIDWASLPQYAGHRWDGTPNPLRVVLEELAASNWVGVESGTSTGKTFLAACIILWFLENFINSIVIITAPKEAQLKLHCWKEIDRLFPVFNRGKLQQLLLRMREDSNEWIAVGFVAGVRAEEVSQSATRAQGFHAEHMLIITEETPGVAQAVMNAFQNTCTAPHNLILALGNPDHTHDPLHMFCQQANVKNIRISAYDHPNVVLHDPEFIPGATSVEGINRLEKRYISKDNPMFQSRVRGISPEQSADSIIRMEWLIAAKNRTQAEAAGTRYRLGVDVANSLDGDEAGIAEGTGTRLEKVTAFPCPDSNQLGERIAHVMRQRLMKGNDTGVDGIGVGAGTVNTLKALGFYVHNIQSAAAPHESLTIAMAEQFANLRAQMWWMLRLDLQDPKSHIVFPEDEELFADLITPRWELRSGKIVVESKDDIRKRLGRSPTKGDAAVYWNWVRHLFDYGGTTHPDAYEFAKCETDSIRGY